MGVDLTKLQSTTLNQSFKNNGIYTGSFNISGNYTSGSMQITQQIVLPANVVIADIIFQGRADGGFTFPTGDPRPNAAWFKRGRVYARGDSTDGSGYSNWPVDFIIGARINGNILTLTATSFRQYTGNLAITAEPVSFKVIDYSVF